LTGQLLERLCDGDLITRDSVYAELRKTTLVSDIDTDNK
jgi:hypothetical protein